MNKRIYIIFKVRKRAMVTNRYNQVPHLTQDTNGKVTTSQLDITNESQEVSPLPAGQDFVFIMWASIIFNVNTLCYVTPISNVRG